MLLLELLLWELPREPSGELRQRLADSRRHASTRRSWTAQLGDATYAWRDARTGRDVPR
ncbi:MAG: hypothetical protein LC749_01485 [Actinobacteria bacterium]|nr:hypothetical protein [Actinomycetota bacterium]